MRCSKAQRLVSAYLDQDLPARGREAIESHLNQCRACAEEVQALTATRRLLSQAPRFTAPPGFSQRVLANLEPRPPRLLVRLQQGLSRGLLSPFPLRFAEAAVLLLMIGLGVLSGRLLTPATGVSAPGAEVTILSLDLFDPAPPGSLSGAYLAMTEVGHEE